MTIKIDRVLYEQYVQYKEKRATYQEHQIAMRAKTRAAKKEDVAAASRADERLKLIKRNQLCLLYTSPSPRD